MQISICDLWKTNITNCRFAIQEQSDCKQNKMQTFISNSEITSYIQIKK